MGFSVWDSGWSRGLFICRDGVGGDGVGFLFFFLLRFIRGEVGRRD